RRRGPDGVLHDLESADSALFEDHRPGCRDFDLPRLVGARGGSDRPVLRQQQAQEVQHVLVRHPRCRPPVAGQRRPGRPLHPARKLIVIDSPGQTVPASPLLQTKLYVPRSRPGLVSRARLIKRLNQAIEGRLTILSAPAGFGKTTLLTQWLAGAATGAPPVAWVSLDQSDNEPTLFWAYLIAALQTVHADVR